MGGIGDKDIGGLPYARADCCQLCCNVTGYLSRFGWLILGLIFQSAFNIAILQIRLSNIPKVDTQS